MHSTSTVLSFSSIGLPQRRLALLLRAHLRGGGGGVGAALGSAKGSRLTTEGAHAALRI